MRLSRRSIRLGLQLTQVGVCLVMALAVVACGPSYPKCDDDEDCKKGEFCVNKLCQKCRNDNDCGAGQQCVGWRCDPIPDYCSDDTDCPDGQECRGSRCVDKPEPPPPAPEAPPPAPEPACSVDNVYFDFDSSALTDSTRDQLSRNARCIRKRGFSTVHLTGMTDPQGTEEYNLALGERRAQSVKQYLQSFGVDGNITTSSMGEEMARGGDESGWQRDRRVEFETR